jgi:CBS domain-containing protein
MKAHERVDRYMTETVLSVDVDQPAGEVLRLLAGYSVHHLPVVKGEKVVGMISAAEITKLKSFLPRTGEARAEYLSQRVQIAAIMRKPAITVRSQATLLEAARTMVSNAVHALPVVDDQERLIGILTTTDIMHAALEPHPPALASEAEPRPTRTELQLSTTEFERALAAAKATVAAGEDTDGMAAALLYLQRRLGVLEHVLQSADRYLKLGQDATQQSALRSAIAAAKRGAAHAVD